MKPHIRVLGIDDSPFTFDEERALFAGVLMRLPNYIEGVSLSSVGVDGEDSAEKIAEMVKGERWNEMLHAILIDGAALAGFNIVDIDALSESTGVPAITVTSEKPDMESIKQALKGHFREWQGRYEMLERRKIHEISVSEGIVYISFSGTDLKEAKEIVRKSVVRGLTPEAVRLAHIIARAVRKSEEVHETEE